MSCTIPKDTFLRRASAASAPPTRRAARAQQAATRPARSFSCMALPWGKQPSSAAVPGSGELDVSIVHWGERSARNANLFSPGKLPKDGAALC